MAVASTLTNPLPARRGEGLPRRGDLSQRPLPAPEPQRAPLAAGRRRAGAHHAEPHRGLVYVTSTQQVIPSVVEVDAAGSATAMRELLATSVEDPVVVQALLGKWLQDVRTLTSRRTGAAPCREPDGLAPFACTHAYTSVPALPISRVGRTRVTATE
jgi:hypothetical protein